MSHLRFRDFIAHRIAAGSSIGDAVAAWNAANPTETAPDTLLTISTISADPYMRQRVASAYAKEQAGPASTGAEGWAFTNAYWWASAPGWAAAWDYAVLTGNTTPGDDPAVVTDAQVIAQVGLMIAPLEPPPVINQQSG